MSTEARKPFRAACIQQACPTDDKDVNLANSIRLVREAARDGAELVMLQELHATRYFCQSEDVAIFDLAETLDGPSRQQLEAVAAELDIVLVASVFEKRTTGLYHNTALVFDGSDGMVGTFRKMHIPDDPGFYEKFYFTPGDADADDPLKGFQPVQTRLGKLGVLVCWDQWYPEAARLMALAGAELLLYPTAIGWDPEDDDAEKQRQLDAWQTIQRAHAIANGVPVLVANRVGFEPSPLGASGVQFWGNSFIAGPQGEWLALADKESEIALSAQVDLERSEAVRRIWPYLRDRRVDAYANLTRRFIDQ